MTPQIFCSVPSVQICMYVIQYVDGGPQQVELNEAMANLRMCAMTGDIGDSDCYGVCGSPETCERLRPFGDLRRPPRCNRTALIPLSPDVIFYVGGVDVPLKASYFEEPRAVRGSACFEERRSCHSRQYRRRRT